MGFVLHRYAAPCRAVARGPPSNDNAAVREGSGVCVSKQ